MATIAEVDEAELAKWVATLPENVQDVVRRLPPGRLYRFKTGRRHRCVPYSYDDDGTIKVQVTGEFNLVIFDRTVFGVEPDDLEECDLPGPDEILGTGITDPAEVDAFCAKQRTAQS